MKTREKAKEKKMEKKIKETNSIISDIERIKFYIQEFESLKRETDWRLQIAYAGPTAYISSLFIAIGLAINTMRGSGGFGAGIEAGILAIAFVLGNAMFIGVFVGNHFIEKKIEMYMLELQMKILELTGDDYYSWISYQHGSVKHNSRLDIFAHAGVGIFQYGIPAILAATTLVVIPFWGPLNGIIAFFYWFAVCALVLALLALFSLTRLTLKVKSQHKLFYVTLYGI